MTAAAFPAEETTLKLHKKRHESLVHVHAACARINQSEEREFGKGLASILCQTLTVQSALAVRNMSGSIGDH
jgi:hypothetical protein